VASVRLWLGMLVMWRIITEDSFVQTWRVVAAHDFASIGEPLGVGGSTLGIRFQNSSPEPPEGGTPNPSTPTIFASPKSAIFTRLTGP
jgi:hypothetical protein